MNKILIIGQAPAAVTQKHPYDTTMLYDWLKECGISKEDAQTMFEFEAVSNVFPGFDDKGGHQNPTIGDMDIHWIETLEEKVQLADRVILLGNVAREFFHNQRKTWSCNLQVLELPHPSKRNFALFERNKEAILSNLKEFVKSK